MREREREVAGNTGNNGDIGIACNACSNIIIGSKGINGKIGIVGNAGNVDLYVIFLYMYI